MTEAQRTKTTYGPKKVKIVMNNDVSNLMSLDEQCMYCQT
jgi:biotin synthase-like enzyme